MTKYKLKVRSKVEVQGTKYEVEKIKRGMKEVQITNDKVQIKRYEVQENQGMKYK